MAFDEYNLARQEVQALVKDGHGRWSPYFRALSHLEITIGQLYVAMDSVRKITEQDLFQSGDGSFEDRLNKLYNASKHQVANEGLPVWFSNVGVYSSVASITFEEIEGYMLKMAGVVKGLCSRETALTNLKDEPGT